MLFLIWVSTLLVALGLYFRQLYTTFQRRGVRAISPLPLLGNMGKVVLQREHFVDSFVRSYSQAPEEKFVGIYQFFKPILMVRDIELIKRITIKDFEHFLDHNTIINKDSDPLFGRNLFSLKGQEWKDMRSTLSPAFTSSKMKLMLPLMLEVGDQMVDALTQKIQDSKDGHVELDTKDLTTRFANDVIASCAFGLKVNSHKDVDNQFYHQGKEASTFSFKVILLFFFSISFPRIASFFKFSIFSENTKEFFRRLVKDTMQERERRNIVRPDMIHLLMEAKKGTLTHDQKSEQDADAGFATVEESTVGKKETNRVWSDDDLTAQAVLFFIAGFETASSAMTFLLYELAVNPDVQERLLREIREQDARSGGRFDYNSVLQMTYLDMVVSELLRLYPPGIQLDRLCIKDYNLGKPNEKAEKDYIVRAGESLSIPAWPIHRDPSYFPNPLKFDPERFSEENKHNIQPFTYMPFGLGPRNCIGSRFALCEVKVLLYQLLRVLEVVPGEKTRIPPVLDPTSFNIRMKGGSWVRFRLRQDA